MPLEEIRHPMSAESTISIPVSPGELIDKISILEIKAERISDSAKRANVRYELALLVEVRRQLGTSDELILLATDLKRVNECLWNIEDAIRDGERKQQFGPEFIALARSVYQNNDRRAALKRRINLLLGSRLLEEKAYTAY